MSRSFCVVLYQYAGVDVYICETIKLPGGDCFLVMFYHCTYMPMAMEGNTRSSRLWYSANVAVASEEIFLVKMEMRNKKQESKALEQKDKEKKHEIYSALVSVFMHFNGHYIFLSAVKTWISWIIHESFFLTTVKQNDVFDFELWSHQVDLKNCSVVPPRDRVMCSPTLVVVETTASHSSLPFLASAQRPWYSLLVSHPHTNQCQPCLQGLARPFGQGSGGTWC